MDSFENASLHALTDEQIERLAAVVLIASIPGIGVPITAFPVLVLLFKLFVGIRLGLLGRGATNAAVNAVSWVLILAVPISFGVWLSSRHVDSP